jgi:SRSO17 transposase
VHFGEFHERSSPLFQLYSKVAGEKSLEYFKGLIQARKKNMERMAETVPFSDDQSLQHFLTNSEWDEQLIVDRIAVDANNHIGGKQDSCLIIDEKGFPKKGDKSVGVKSQWCGQLGKVYNCQVGVFSALGYREHATPVGFKLYLPEDWTDDRERCEAAGIPDESIVFYSKHDLAFQLVLEARRQGIQFGWVGADGFYGENPAFLRSLDQINETFMTDVHKDQNIYLKNPEPVVPERRSNRGPKPKNLKAQTEPIRADKWLEQQPEEAWQRTIVRDTTKGKLLVGVLHSLYALGWRGTGGTLLAPDCSAGSDGEKSKIQIEQCSREHLAGTIDVYASTALLDRAFISGCKGGKWFRGVPGPKVALLASPYGNGHDGNAVFVRATPFI